MIEQRIQAHERRTAVSLQKALQKQEMTKSNIALYNKVTALQKEEQKTRSKQINFEDEQNILASDIRSKQEADKKKKDLKLAHRMILNKQNQQLINEKNSGDKMLDAHI